MLYERGWLLVDEVQLCDGFEIVWFVSRIHLECINVDIQNEYENVSNYGEKYLVYKVKKSKIYVKCWSDIITEFEINNSFLLDKLQLQQKVILEQNKKTAKEIVEEQSSLSSKMPSEIKVA